MKKLSRIAALLAAGAALLMVGAGFVSCSEDEEEDNSPKLTISADSAVSVEAGEPIDVTLTATLKNDSFAGAIPSGVDLSAYVTVTPSNAASFENDLAVTATEDIAAGGTTAKVNITVTTTAEAVSGTIKVTIAGEALKSGKDLTSNALSYTIASGNAGGSDPVVQAKTYNFAGLGFSDFPANSLTAKSDGSTVLSALGSETQPYFAVGTWTVADATVKATNSKRISARFTDAATTAVNIGNSNMTSATSAAADNYIKITAPGAGTVKMTYKITAATADSKTGAADATAALTSASAVLASKTYDTTYATYSALTDEVKTSTYNNQELEVAVSAGQEVYVGYFRGTGANTGNIDVYKIEFTPASAD